MSVYLFGQVKEYDLAGLDYRQTYQQQVLGKLPQQALYVCAQLPEQKDMELYRRAGVCAEQVLGVHRYLADHCEMTASVRAKDKLEELKDSLQATGVEERESEIWLIRDGCVIATIALEEGNREYCRGIYYYSFTRLIRAEYYQDGIAYAEYFKTAESERGLYAKLVRRSFYNRDGSAAYDQIFAGDQEWYLFPDGFWIYDESGKRICETRNIHQHYIRIEGYEAEHGFAVKAFVDTVNGKMAIAETGLVYPHTGHYDIPRVSLVIPVYNAEAYIARTLDNALAQSLPELEILAVDDGCTDSTPKILDWYAGKYPNVVVIHKENGGVAAARNTGIEAARGEYIGFMDNDDMIRPEMMERLYDSARRNDCDVAVTSVYTVRSNQYIKSVQYAAREDMPILAEEFFKLYYMYGSELGVVVWNKLYRASFIKVWQFPVFPYDDMAWTTCILSYAEKICYLDGMFYEWDRTIRNSTLLGEWDRYEKQEMFEYRKTAILYYMNHGNPERMALLKESAKVFLKSWESVYSYEEYGKLWQEIEEKW